MPHKSPEDYFDHLDTLGIYNAAEQVVKSKLEITNPPVDHNDARQGWVDQLHLTDPSHEGALPTPKTPAQKAIVSGHIASLKFLNPGSRIHDS